MNNNNLNKFVIDDTVYETIISEKYAKRKKYVPKNSKIVSAAIPGVIKQIFIKEGDILRKGSSMLILEAMKMNNDILSPIDGKIKTIHVSVGKKVFKEQMLVEFE